MTQVRRSVLIDLDSYKVSHPFQYPPGTTSMKAYFTSRGGIDKITFFGLQYLIKEYLTQRITTDDVLDASRIVKDHMGYFPEEGWMYIARELNGMIPLKITALPEGSTAKTGEPLFLVESTDEVVPWVVSWFETMLVRVWYPTTVASYSAGIRRELTEFWEKTSDAPFETMLFKLHDFGSRGVSSRETAMLGGMAHLVNFLGSDTIEALRGAQQYYKSEEVAGFSIPATEHSTMTAWGPDREVEAVRHMIKMFDKDETSILSIVSDSYDYYAMLDKYGTILKEDIENLKGTLVIRPDSGDTVTTILNTLDILGGYFGTETNSKGYRVLPKYIRIIQGDGINAVDIGIILRRMERQMWSVDNIAFGMGGGLLQLHGRDDGKFAYKLCQATIEGETVDITKSPVDAPDKKSAGFSELDFSNLRVVFENGYAMNTQSLTEIRARAWGSP